MKKSVSRASELFEIGLVINVNRSIAGVYGQSDILLFSGRGRVVFTSRDRRGKDNALREGVRVG